MLDRIKNAFQGLMGGKSSDSDGAKEEPTAAAPTSGESAAEASAPPAESAASGDESPPSQTPAP
jgi:hypothetical protein